jgi:hypothetical protein
MSPRILELLDLLREEVKSGLFSPVEIGVIIGALFEAKIWRMVPDQGEFTRYLFEQILERFPHTPPQSSEDIFQLLEPYFTARGLSAPSRTHAGVFYNRVSVLFNP